MYVCMYVQSLWGLAALRAPSTGLRLVASGIRPFRKIHVRSPELFDELVLADGKREAWAPRANKITGQWFDQIKNLKDVSANLLFLKSEDGPRVRCPRMPSPLKPSWCPNTQSQEPNLNPTLAYEPPKIILYGFFGMVDIRTL